MSSGVERSIGQIALQLGLITEKQLQECVEAQRQESTFGKPKRLGEFLVERGYITQDGLAKVLTAQRRMVEEREREGFSRIGVGDAFRMLGALEDALASYRGVLDEFGDCLKVSTAARRKVAEVEAELKSGG